MKRQWIVWAIVALGLATPVLSQAERHGGRQQQAQTEHGRHERWRMPDYGRQQEHHNLGAGLTPDQRRELRRDVDQAGRQLYRNQGRGHGHR